MFSGSGSLDKRRTTMGDTQANQRKKTRGEDYIAQGSILAVAVVITKIIGVVYRIPLTNILGDEG